jgi:hypothetical protein
MITVRQLLLMVCVASISTASAMAQYAAQVISYSQGATTATNFLTPSAALGEPSRFTNDPLFPSVVSPFSPPFGGDQIVSIGEGGEITMRLSKYAIPQSGGLPELGIFGNVGLTDLSYPNGSAGTPATTFNGVIESATVEVSADGTSWYSFGNVAMDVPTNGYTDVSSPFAGAPGSTLTDFQQPFVGSLSSFDGKNFSPDMLNLLGGSGGGKWLDISNSGLSHVGFVRFSIADDGNASTKLKFELDAVSVSHAALGNAVVPEPSAALLLFIAAAGLSCRYSAAQLRKRAEG